MQAIRIIDAAFPVFNMFLDRQKTLFTHVMFHFTGILQRGFWINPQKNKPIGNRCMPFWYSRSYGYQA